MQLKKFYILIGLCLVLILAIGFVSLRSDVPDEPVTVYKATTPTGKSGGSSAPAIENEGTSFSMVKTSFSASSSDTATSGTYTASKPQNYEEIKQLRAENIKQLQAQLADLEAEGAKLQTERDELKQTLTEVRNFYAWVKSVDLQSSFSDFLHVRSLSKEEIQEQFSAEDFRAFVLSNASRFNAICEEFLARIENCSPGAKAIIYEQIHADPVSSQIYYDYIENPERINGGQR